jgi:hypothetical protein
MVRQRFVLSATLAGFVLAHALDYAIVYPDPRQRAHVLRHTGHAYLGSLRGAAWTLLGLGLVVALAQGLGSRSRERSPRYSVALLAAAQSAFFVSAEVGERVRSHEPLRDLFHGPLLAVGLAAQVVVAALLVGLLVAVERTGRRYALVAPAPVPRPVLPRPATPYVARPHSFAPLGLAPARAPPGR